MELLTGNRVTVASYGVAAAFAGWILQRFGAAVTHLTALDMEGIGAFLAEGGTPANDPLRDLAGANTGASPVLVTDAPVNAANRELIEQHARECLVVWITPYGLGNAWSDREVTDLGLHATGGWMSAVGEPGREPLGPPGAQGQFVAGQFAAIAALAEPLLAERRTGLVDVAMVEAVAATCIYETVGYQYHGVTRVRAGNRFSYANSTLVTLPCKDGHAGIHAALHRQWLALCDLVGHPEMPSDPRFASPLERAAHAAEMDQEALLPWLAGRTHWEAFHALQNARVAASAMPTLQEVLDSPQLAARQAWRQVTTPSGRGITVPGAPARVVAEAGPGSRAGAPGPWRDGALRIVDFSMGWAGPLVSQILACLGADVIKVEGPNRFDWWRGSRPPGDDPALALHERSHVFNTANRGKRGLTLDLQHVDGRAIALELVAGADVVVENFSAGVLERMGITYEVLTANNPGLVMLRQPGFGSTGPEARYVAFGTTMEGMSGLTRLMGYDGGPPQMMSNACGDPVSGLHGTIAVLAALDARKRDGKGRCIEAAQLEGFLPMVSEALIEYQRTGIEPVRAGNRRPGHVPSGLFPCAGDDRWVAIDVRSDGDWAALAAAIAEPWAQAPGLAGLDGREAARDEVEKKLAAWTGTRERDDIVALLGTAGVPAAPMHNEPDLLAWDVLAERGFFAPQERAFVGTHLYPALPMLVDHERALPHVPAPVLGEHTESVLAAMGYGSAQLAALRAAGVISWPSA
jgi:crotonobetainyl-CoA:carnitine CoA-transferase CaiB-like acyl-CoA transferase